MCRLCAPIWINNTNLAAERSGRRQRHGHRRTWADGSASGPKLYSSPRPRPVRLRPGHHVRELRHRDEGGRALVQSTSRTVSGRPWRRWPVAVSTRTTGIWGSTSRGNFSETGPRPDPATAVGSPPGPFEQHHREDIVISKKQSLSPPHCVSLAYACGGSSTTPSPTPGPGGGTPGPWARRSPSVRTARSVRQPLTIESGRERSVREQPQPARIRCRPIRTPITRTAPRSTRCRRLTPDKAGQTNEIDDADVRNPRPPPTTPTPSLRGEHHHSVGTSGVSTRDAARTPEG